jgi:hypothetical protein
MKHWKEVAAIRDRLAPKYTDTADALFKKLPSAARRMGLVRTLEWLPNGKTHAALGKALFEELAPLLGLPMTIDKAVDHLETCSRRELFEHQRNALALFDLLATLQRGQRHAETP